MVTRDVYEAVFLSDRVVMTSGPEAHVGPIPRIPFARRRSRHALMDLPELYDVRQHLVGLL